MIDIAKLREDKRPQSSTIVHALLDRLEAAERERDDLRAKIAEMEKQEPAKYERRIKLRSKHTWGAWWECDKGDYVKAKAAGGHYPKFSDDLLDYEMRPLYALPGAQNVPSVPDEVMVVLDHLDDYIARIEGDDRGACGLINLVRRYLLDAAEVGGSK